MSWSISVVPDQRNLRSNPGRNDYCRYRETKATSFLSSRSRILRADLGFFVVLHLLSSVLLNGTGKQKYNDVSAHSLQAVPLLLSVSNILCATMQVSRNKWISNVALVIVFIGKLLSCCWFGWVKLVHWAKSCVFCKQRRSTPLFWMTVARPLASRAHANRVTTL